MQRGVVREGERGEREVCGRRSISSLLLDLVVDGLGCLGLFGGEEAAEPAKSLVADDEGGVNGGQALGDEALLVVAGLFDLAVVDVEDVVTALNALVEGDEKEVTGVLVDFASGLLDGGEALIDAAEGLIAEGVCLADVGGEVLVWLLEIGHHGAGERLIGRVAEAEGALGELVGFEGGDAVIDEGVVEKMLDEGGLPGSAGDVAVDLGDGH